MSDSANNSSISCSCGKCELVLNERRAMYAVLCGCEDCRQALSWGASKGGKKPELIVFGCYMRSDIAHVKGQSEMCAVQLRDGARSTRVYCSSCYSIIGIDHPSYQDNVFLIFPKHCQTTCDVELEPSAVLFLNDYPEEVAPVPSEEIPVFHALVYPQERARCRSIPIVANTLCPPSSPPKGQTLSQLIDSLEGLEILGLDRGQAV